MRRTALCGRALPGGRMRNNDVGDAQMIPFDVMWRSKSPCDAKPAVPRTVRGIDSSNLTPASGQSR